MKILFLLSIFLFFGCSDNSSSSITNPTDSSSSSSITNPQDSSFSSSSIIHSSYSSSITNPASSFSSYSSSSIAYSSLSAIISSSSENTSFQDLCVQFVNEYRATEDLSPLSRASLTQESCTQDQASQDLKSGVAHGHFGSCEEWAQNTAPSINVAFYKSEEEMLKKYLKMMWVDEKQLVLEGVADYQKIGHYLNMRNTSYKSLACGIAYNQDKSTAWINMNFY